jgi:hypothetical protein
MMFGKAYRRRHLRTAVAFLIGGCFTLGLIESCDDRLLTVTEWVDPCGTIFANCEPGDFQVNAAGAPAYCLDPACTVPGQCGNEGNLLGLTADICP